MKTLIGRFTKRLSNRQKKFLLAISGVILYVATIVSLFNMRIVPVCSTCQWSYTLFELSSGSGTMMLTDAWVLIVAPAIAVITSFYIGVSTKGE